jgi:hypothetical protein
MRHKEHNRPHDVASEKRTEWDRTHPVSKKLLETGAQAFMSKERHPQIDKAFTPNVHCVCCMDEGTAHMERGSKLFMAGSGILYPAASWDDRLNRVADLFIDLHITEITSHDGCGAAGIAFKRDGGEEGTGCKTADEHGEKWCSDLQAIMDTKLDVPENVEGVQNVHIHEHEMERPGEFHIARVVWFDATGEFTKPDMLGEEIPKGFAINYHAFASREMGGYPLSELEVAIKIAFSDHGFDKEFTKGHPFVIIVIAKDEDQKKEVMELIGSTIQGNKEISHYLNRIKIDGFIHA